MAIRDRAPKLNDDLSLPEALAMIGLLGSIDEHDGAWVRFDRPHSSHAGNILVTIWDGEHQSEFEYWIPDLIAKTRGG